MDKKTKKSSVAFLAMLIITIVGIIGLAVFLMWQENRSVLMAEEIESSETRLEPVSEISEPEEEPVPEPGRCKAYGSGRRFNPRRALYSGEQAGGRKRL